MRITDIEFAELFDLEPHGPDTFVGQTVSYPWGTRLFGGQVVAQALRAAALTVARPVHSLHAYFIRPGSHLEPIRFEVERLRDGRSFSTRQVVARQSAGAILNASLSFHSPEPEADVVVGGLPEGLPGPDDPGNIDDGWGHLLQRRTPPDGAGFDGHWIRLDTDLGDDPVLHSCALAFMSDSAPFRTARACHPDLTGGRDDHGNAGCLQIADRGLRRRQELGLMDDRPVEIDEDAVDPERVEPVREGHYWPAFCATTADTFLMSSSDSWPEKAGIAPLPFVTTASTWS